MWKGWATKPSSTPSLRPWCRTARPCASGRPPRKRRAAGTPGCWRGITWTRPSTNSRGTGPGGSSTAWNSTMPAAASPITSGLNTRGTASAWWRRWASGSGSRPCSSTTSSSGCGPARCGACPGWRLACWACGTWATTWTASAGGRRWPAPSRASSPPRSLPRRRRLVPACAPKRTAAATNRRSSASRPAC